MRYAILFHLLAPGGKWQPWIGTPRRTANTCHGSLFQYEMSLTAERISNEQ